MTEAALLYSTRSRTYLLSNVNSLSSALISIRYLRVYELLYYIKIKPTPRRRRENGLLILAKVRLKPHILQPFKAFERFQVRIDYGTAINLILGVLNLEFS